MYKIKNNIITSMVSGVLLAYSAVLFITGVNPFSKSSAGQVSLILVAGLTVLFSGAFFALFHIRKRVRREAIIITLMLYGVTGAYVAINASFYFAVVILSAAALLIYGFKEAFPDRSLKRVIFDRKWNLWALTGVGFLLAVTVVSLGTIARYDSYVASNFDFGLFCQMYESMATDFTQNTTLERNTLLSHFAVHFSPIYYVLLPFYMIFRCPEFLLIAQAAVAFSAVIPLVLICKRWRYSDMNILLIAAVFLALPYLTGACFYDFHENAFLPPLLLWLFYFLEKGSLIGTNLLAILVLCVKEDAGLYLICIGIYALLNRNYSKLNAVLLLITGVSGFIAVTSFINAYGEGIKTSRYSIYLLDGQDSLTDVILNVIKNPSYMINTLLSEKKLKFLLYVTLPLGFACFKTRRVCDYALFLPLLLVNLATDYPYQYEINYQYVFGTATIMVFLFARNLRYIKKKKKFLVFCLGASVIMCLTANMGRYRANFEAQRVFAEENDATDKVLAELPNDASITATTYLIPHLYDNKEVYMLPYNEKDTDFVVLDNREGKYSEFDEKVSELKAKGYVLYKEEGYATIYVSAEYVFAEE